MRIFILTFLCGIQIHRNQALQPKLEIDCQPNLAVSKENCDRVGCVWNSAKNKPGPKCYFKNGKKKMTGYDVLNSQISATVWSANLIRRNTPSLFGSDVRRLSLLMEALTESHFYIKITDSLNETFQVPHRTARLNIERLRKSKASQNCTLPYEVTLHDSPFGITVTRLATGTRIFDSANIPGFIFSKKFLQMTTRLPSVFLYGLGEHNHEFLRHDLNWKKYGFFNRDNAPRFGENTNLYGYHPFYLCLEPGGVSHGVVFFTSHAMNIELQPGPALTFRAIGGQLEIHIFMGPSPDEVIQQYLGLVGKPAMPPYWGLGFQLSRYGYHNLSHLESVLDRNQAAGIPLDVQYMDIDYMNKYQDFTYDSVRYQNLPKFIERLHARNIKLIPIIDPGIASDNKFVGRYPALDNGITQDVFVKVKSSGKPLEGIVWPGKTVFPDFSSPATHKYWKELLMSWHNKVHYDGIWLDMNEPSNFVPGSINGCEQNSVNHPPYNPLLSEKVYDRTICLDSMHRNGTNTHNELHNMYGFFQAQMTDEVLREIFPEKRVFILSRSTFLGSGVYGAHWTGDIISGWNEMKQSIITCLEFNMFGVPWVGADVCGFEGDTSEELCVRWHQLGAFYPFFRNHNNLGNRVDQDPASWSLTATNSIRLAIAVRYQLLPYLSNLFLSSHVNGSTVMRPLFFEFPRDAKTWEIDDQFMWGSSIMFAPILSPDSIERSIYFPEGRWYNGLSHEVVLNLHDRYIVHKTDWFGIGLYFRGGSIIPLQPHSLTTHLSRQNPLVLAVFLSERDAANGSLIWDDGETLDSYQQGLYMKTEFNLEFRQGIFDLVICQVFKGLDSLNVRFNSVVVMGLRQEPRTMKSLGTSLSLSNHTYDPEKQLLIISINLEFSNNYSNCMSINWY